MGQINSIKLKLNFKGDGLKIDINVNLKQFNISWQEEIIDALKKIIEIIKKYDLKNPRIFNDYFIDISELMKKLKFTPSGNSGFLYTQIEEDKYKPLSFLSSVESGIPTTFTANVNISNHTMEEITEGITKLILNFYDEINDILNNQVFIVDKFIDIIKQRID